jgi:hypothetical protein
MFRFVSRICVPVAGATAALSTVQMRPLQ